MSDAFLLSDRVCGGVTATGTGGAETFGAGPSWVLRGLCGEERGAGGEDSNRAFGVASDIGMVGCDHSPNASWIWVGSASGAMSRIAAASATDIGAGRIAISERSYFGRGRFSGRVSCSLRPVVRCRR